MTPTETRAQLSDAIRALVPFAVAARRDHLYAERLDLLASMLYAIEECSMAELETEAPRMARAITWAAYLLPTEGGAH